MQMSAGRLLDEMLVESTVFPLKKKKFREMEMIGRFYDSPGQVIESLRMNQRDQREEPPL